MTTTCLFTCWIHYSINILCTEDMTVLRLCGYNKHSTGFIINTLISLHAIFCLMWISFHGSYLFLAASPRWMPAVCWRREWTPLRRSTVRLKRSPTPPSIPTPSCSRGQLCRPTTFWLGPVSSTNTPASSFPFRSAPSTWSTGSSISPRTPWRCPGEQMAWLLQIIPAFVVPSTGWCLLRKSVRDGASILVHYLLTDYNLFG